MMGLSPAPSPEPDVFLEEGDVLSFGEINLEVLFTPGHSPGHISFFHRESKQLFSGDVLFQGSIGRVDLPGGSYPVLMDNIINKVLPLGDDVVVYCGHGPTTTIGRERVSNPFILNYQA
jgi:glyoxylase-like metal-dependent hydrolase (beta-lactamase superfamily II)